jgi:hypothetical protein
MALHLGVGAQAIMINERRLTAEAQEEKND